MRWPTALALLVAGAAHIPVIPAHLNEAPYMGVAFVGFTVVALVLATVVAVRAPAIAIAASAVACAAAIATYAATRLVAFPQLADDVGNWGERLGVVSIASEAVVVVLACFALRRRAGAALAIA